MPRTTIRDPPRQVGDRVDRRVRALEGRGLHRRRRPARDAEERVGLRLRRCLGGLFRQERRPVGSREAAVLAHAPHVVQEEEADRGRERDDVQDVEADQRRLVDRAPAEEQLADRRPGERDRGRDVRSHRDRPVRELVPREEIAREGKEEGAEEEAHAEHPVLLPLLPLSAAVLVGAREEDAHHVEEDDDHHEMRGQAVHRANPEAERRDVLDVLHGSVRALDGRDVKEEERQSGHRDEEQQRRRGRAEPERIVPVERRLVGLRREPVEQEVRHDRVARLAVGGRPDAPQRLRMDAGRARGRRTGLFGFCAHVFPRALRPA